VRTIETIGARAPQTKKIGKSKIGRLHASMVVGVVLHSRGVDRFGRAGRE
jgi:hypothetical protein